VRWGVNITLEIKGNIVNLYNVNLNNINDEVYKLIQKYDLDVSEIIDLVRWIKYNLEGVDRDGL